MNEGKVSVRVVDVGRAVRVDVPTVKAPQFLYLDVDGLEALSNGQRTDLAHEIAEFIERLFSFYAVRVDDEDD